MPKSFPLSPTPLSVPAIACGLAVGGIFGAMNIYLGLKTGMTLNGSLVVAIISYALLHRLKTTALLDLR